MCELFLTLTIFWLRGFTNHNVLDVENVELYKRPFCRKWVYAIFRELLDFLSTSRTGRQDDIDAGQLIALLKMKDEELQATVKTGLYLG